MWGAYWERAHDIDAAIKQQRAGLVAERDAWEDIATRQGRRIIVLEAESADLRLRAEAAEAALQSRAPKKPYTPPTLTYLGTGDDAADPLEDIGGQRNEP